MSTTKTITSKILSNIDISLLNHQAKYFYDNISDTIDIEFDENDLYIANIVQENVKEYNDNPHTTTKIKVPSCNIGVKQTLYYIVLLIVFLLIVTTFLGLDANSIITSFITNITSSEIYNKSKEKPNI